jgi:hypothetical protein
MSARRRGGRVALILAFAAAAWSALTAISGGFVLDAGLRISSRDPVRPLAAALILFAFARAMLPASEFRLALRRLGGGSPRACNAHRRRGVDGGAGLRRRVEHARQRRIRFLVLRAAG